KRSSGIDRVLPSMGSSWEHGDYRHLKHGEGRHLEHGEFWYGRRQAWCNPETRDKDLHVIPLRSVAHLRLGELLARKAHSLVSQSPKIVVIVVAIVPMISIKILV